MKKMKGGKQKMFDTRKKNISKLFLIFVASLFLSGIMAANALAYEFVNPPETNAPSWSTAFSYQRNIYWDFNVDPQGGPPGSLPGAVYEGTLDPVLWDSDYLQFEGATAWYETSDLTSRTGLVGIDNRTGTETLEGWLKLKLDNVKTPNIVKHIWGESEAIMSSGVSYTPYIELPDGYTLTDYWLSDGELLPDGFSRTNAWFEIKPNPEWELFVTHVAVPVGEYLLIDNMHIATECVPIPGSVLLMGSGLLGLIGLGRKKIFSS